MLKKSSLSLFYISLLFISIAHAMDPDAYRYELDVFKHADVQDSYKIKIRQTDQLGSKKSGSFTANFATHSCDDQKNLFAPFDMPMKFGDAADADSFLWDVPDFGVLKLHHDGSTFFGHSPREIPLAADALTLRTSGELFLQTLRVAALHLGSKKTHLCEMLVADAISTEDKVLNSGSLQTSRLFGGGTFCNEGVVEFRGNQHAPALLGIKAFVNQSNEHRKPTVHASHLTATRDNEKIINKKNTEFEVSEELVIEEPSIEDASLQNKGLFKTGVCDARRTITNEGFLQANKLTARKLLENDQFGQVKILEQIFVEDLNNDGEIDAQKSITISKGINKGSITGSPDLTVRILNELENDGDIRLQQLVGGSRVENRKSLLFHNNASITIQGLTNHGLLKAASASLIHTQLSNTATGIVELFGKSRIDNTTVLNSGEVTIQGDTDLASANISNKGRMALRSGNLAYNNSTLSNEGGWLFQEIKSSDPIGMTTNGTLELADSSLSFDYLHNQRSFISLANNKGLILHSGTYKVKDFRNTNMQLGGRDWVITDNPAQQSENRLLLTKIFPYTNVGEIEAEHDLHYDLAVMPVRIQAEEINLSKRRMSSLDLLQRLTTSKKGKVTAWCAPATIANGDILFPKIGHLELHVNGPLTKYGKLIAPALSLYVNGPFTGGKSNAELATIAATHGPLKVTADSIDGSYAKFYGKGKTDIEATKGDLQVGSYKQGVDEDIKQQFIQAYVNSQLTFYTTPYFFNLCLSAYDYSLSVRNGAYVASDDFLTLQSAKKMSIYYGLVSSALGINLISPPEIYNGAGKISSHGPIAIESDLYTHTRATPAHKAPVVPGWNAYIEYPGSIQAELESLKKITFRTKKISNYASSIRSASSLILNGKDELTPATGYVETPQHYYFRGTGGWCNTYLFSQACTLQSGKNIQASLGDFVVTGNWNASGVINIRGRAGLFSNGGKLTRETTNPTGPIVVDVTQYMQNEAQQPGFYRRAENGAVETEFPFSAPSAPQPGDMVALENPHYQTPLHWHNLFNPLRSIDLNLPLQQLLSKFANATYAGRARGNQTATVLWGNANRWRARSGKGIMSQADLQQADESMLLSQIVSVGLTPQQRTLLCIVPEDVNRHKDAIVAGEFRAVTQGDQVHLNDQIIAKGPGGIRVASQAGDVIAATQSHTVQYGDSDGAWVTEQRAYPQQQFIAEAGPVDITAHRNISRTGTAIVAGTTVHQQAQTGSFSNVPLTLQKISEKTDVEDGLFSSKTTITTNVSHQILPSTTIAGTHLHDQAGTSIYEVAPQDVAGQSITKQSPNTVIEGIILADHTTVQSSSSSMFSEQSSTNMQEAPCSMEATIRAPQIRFIGNKATVNANIAATELHDDTRDGVQFVAKVKEMLYSQQTLVDSPLMSMDAGCRGGYETMIPPMLMVDRIIRVSPLGQMLFESAVINKDRTQIIGRFVETTYQLKKWHEEWCHKDQAISDEMLVAIAIAITVATDGMGAELLAITAEHAALAAMVNAGFSTLCATVGTSVLRTGDPLQAIEKIASPEFLKSFAIDVASAGLCQKLGGALNVNMASGSKPLINHVQAQALKTTVDTLLNVAINDAPVGKSIGNAVAQISLNAIAGYVSNNICDAHLNGIEREAAHSVLGGAVGFAKDGNSKGLASGAVGALTAQTVGDILTSDAFAVSDAAIGRLKKDGKPMTQENIQKAVEQEVAYRMKFAKVASATVAAAAGLNPSIASQTASNALDNDVAIRAQIYSLSEMQSLLTAAGRAVVNLTVQPEQPEQSKQSEQPAQESKRRKPEEAASAKTGAGKKSASKKSKPVSVSNSVRLTAEEESNIVHNLVLNTIGRQPEAALAETGDLIMECADEWRPHNYAKPKRSLADRIINPEQSPFIKETSEIINAAVDHAVNKTIDTYATIPNIVGAALPALLLSGSEPLKAQPVDTYDDLMKQYEQKPFVENPERGIWIKGCFSGDLNLHKGLERLNHQLMKYNLLDRDEKCPFVVFAHGTSSGILVGTQDIHPNGLHSVDKRALAMNGEVFLNVQGVKQLIETAPGYKKGQHIHLFSCNGGSDSNGIAQQLANEMDVSVSGFTGYAAVNILSVAFASFADGNMVKSLWPELKEIKTFYPRGPKAKPTQDDTIAQPDEIAENNFWQSSHPLDSPGVLDHTKDERSNKNPSHADRIPIPSTYNDYWESSHPLDSPGVLDHEKDSSKQ